jgi:hypothetical protein
VKGKRKKEQIFLFFFVPFPFDSVDFCDDGGFYGDVHSLDGIT